MGLFDMTNVWVVVGLFDMTNVWVVVVCLT